MKLNFPVFVLKENDSMIYVFFKEKDLKKTNTAILNSNVFKNVELIDSTGLCFKISRAFKVRYKGFWGLSLLYKGRQIIIDFEFENQSKKITLDELKENIIKKVSQTKTFWESGWPDINEFLLEIKESSSFGQLAELLK